MLTVEREHKIVTAFEDRSGFDLTCKCHAQHVLGISGQHKFLYPLPNNEILAEPDLGQLVQNPGY